MQQVLIQAEKARREHALRFQVPSKCWEYMTADVRCVSGGLSLVGPLRWPCARHGHVPCGPWTWRVGPLWPWPCALTWRVGPLWPWPCASTWSAPGGSPCWARTACWCRMNMNRTPHSAGEGWPSVCQAHPVSASQPLTFMRRHQRGTATPAGAASRRRRRLQPAHQRPLVAGRAVSRPSPRGASAWLQVRPAPAAASAHAPLRSTAHGSALPRHTLAIAAPHASTCRCHVPPPPRAPQNTHSPLPRRVLCRRR
jgi:hypothetical protein